MSTRSLEVVLPGKETHSWDDLSLPFFPPLSYLRVNLVSKLRFDFPSVAGKESKESLCPAVDYIDFVQRDGVDDLFALLDFTFWALYKPCLRGKQKDFR